MTVLYPKHPAQSCKNKEWTDWYDFLGYAKKK